MTVNQARLRPGVIILAGLLAAACGAPDPDAQAGDRSDTEVEAGSQLLFVDAADREGAQIAARVGETVILISDVRREAAARELVDDAANLHPATPAFQRVLNDLVDQRLLALEAARLDLEDGAEARRRLAAAQERILGNILVETVVSELVTEEAVQRVYDEQSRLAPTAMERRARHILVETREEADELARLLAEGADFAQLAARVSQDPATRFDGGDLGYFTRNGILPAFADVAFDTPVGDVSAPFQTEYGWHVLTVTDRRRQPRPGLDARRGDIVRFLTLQGIDELLGEIRDTYPVELTAQNPPDPGEGGDLEREDAAGRSASPDR